MKYLILSLFLAMPLPQNLTVDAAAAGIDFSVKGPFGTVHGTLGGLKAEIQFDEKNPSAGSIHTSVDVKTIKTGNGKRDRDLCNESVWFDAAKNPTISFVSKKITKTADGYSAAGELTMKGVTKPYTIPFAYTGNVFKSSFTVKRADFGLGKSGMVGDDVSVSLTVPVKK